MSGRVPKTFQRVAAKHAIARVMGVRGLTDEVVISREQVANEVGAEVSAALARYRPLENATLRVSMLGSTIYLDGTVASYTAERTARDIARWAPGVAAVIDRTRVAA
jgi:osmotically-inducible protein OsmY